MRSVYWILAAGVVAALFAAAWFAGQLSGDNVDMTPIDAQLAERVLPPEPLAADEDVFDKPEIDARVAPEFDIVRISRNGTGVVAGRADAGKKVELLVNGEPKASAIADTNGEWVIILSSALPAGAVELSLRIIGADGRPIDSKNIVVIEVPENGEDGVLAVLSPRVGDGPSRTLQVPGANTSTVMSLYIASIDILPDGSAIATGLASRGDSLRIYVNNAYINEVVADDDGNWRLVLGVLSGEDEHELRVDQIARGEGEVSLRIVQPFNKENPIDTSQSQRAVVVTRGNNLWAIARSIYGGGELYSLIFEQNAGQIRNPDLIYPGQVFNLPMEQGETLTAQD